MQVSESLAYLAHLYPSMEWEQAMADLFASRLAPLEISVEQTKAVFGEYRMTVGKFNTKTPDAAGLYRRLKEVAYVPTAAKPRVELRPAELAPTTGYMRELWVRWKKNPEEPCFKRLAANGSLPWLLECGKAEGAIS